MHHTWQQLFFDLKWNRMWPMDRALRHFTQQALANTKLPVSTQDKYLKGTGEDAISEFKIFHFFL